MDGNRPAEPVTSRRKHEQPAFLLLSGCPAENNGLTIRRPENRRPANEGWRGVAVSAEEKRVGGEGWRTASEVLIQRSICRLPVPVSCNMRMFNRPKSSVSWACRIECAERSVQQRDRLEKAARNSRFIYTPHSNPATGQAGQPAAKCYRVNTPIR